MEGHVWPSVQYVSKGIVPYNMKRIYQRLRWNIILWGFVFINEKVMGFFRISTL